VELTCGLKTAPSADRELPLIAVALNRDCNVVIPTLMPS
jgi:hypothetical protein